MATPNIRSATYSNIAVYELLIRGIPVMIRKSDAFVNATQILRAAGLPKPARTKVLDRQVARGVHEKVQGGYAGSQGTWIPLSSAKELARTYGILQECMPLFDYDMASGVAELVSPPIKIRRTVSKQMGLGSDIDSSGGNFINEMMMLLPRDIWDNSKIMDNHQLEKHAKRSLNAHIWTTMTIASWKRSVRFIMPACQYIPKSIVV